MHSDRSTAERDSRLDLPPAVTATRPSRGARLLQAVGLRIERRTAPRYPGLYRVVAIVVGLTVALLLAPLIAGASGSDLYNYAWTGTLGSNLGIDNVLTIAVPLIIGGLAAAIPYRLGLWNIGIDGQILMGAWVALAFGFSLSGLPAALLIPIMFLGGCIGGAVWMLGPALARVYLGLNEIITTFLLNFVAVAWMTYWVTGPWSFIGASGGGLRSKPIPRDSQLNLIHLGGAEVHWGLIVAIALPVAAWLATRFTRTGYELTITGASERAARYAGIQVRRRLMGALLISGALGGLAGVVDMMGNLHNYGDGLTNNTGFSAVVIAVLAGGAELGVIVMGFVYAILLAGGDAVGLAGVDPNLVFALVGITLMIATIGDALSRFRVVRTKVGRGATAPAAIGQPAPVGPGGGEGRTRG